MIPINSLFTLLSFTVNKLSIELSFMEKTYLPHLTHQHFFLLEIQIFSLACHLFAIGGTRWRNLRTKLSPTFTSGKLKMMFNTLVDCGLVLQKYVENNIGNEEGTDIKEVLGEVIVKKIQLFLFHFKTCNYCFLINFLTQLHTFVMDIEESSPSSFFLYILKNIFLFLYQLHFFFPAYFF